jgi:phosphoribosylformimino-5-aminoimidazole carboxamide ribotide isomerase
MRIYPAIDLRGGRCVRLREGDFAQETVYGDDPVAVAKGFERDGATWLHVVDLDGARAGRPLQADLIAAICRAVSMPVQAGGGLRDVAAVDAVLAAGAARAIVGTAAVRDPARCAAMCAKHPGRVAVGVDARDGRVRVSGWLEDEALDALTLAQRVAGEGAAAVIYTDIGRDGTERGPDVEGTKALADALAIPVIASGGVGSLEHVRALVSIGVDGVIIGRALYTGAVTLQDALAVAGGRG